MADLPPSSLPPSHPTYRHLGTAVVDRSVRIQMLVALVAGLVMVAVPLYLWRRPRSEAPAERDARKSVASASASAPLTALDLPAASTAAPSPAKTPGLLLSEPKTLRCSSGKSRVPPEQCDRQTPLEELLLKTLQETPACAPEKGASGSINFVLDVDHKTKKLKVWAGKSSTLKKAPRKKVLACVARALPTPEWAQLIHQHQKYQISVLATYP